MSVTRREWLWVAVAAGIVLLVATLPTIAGYLAQTPEDVFLGAVYDVQDYHSHLAKMQLGARGELGYRSLFTTEPHPSEPVILPYILLGYLASRLGVPLPVAYQIFRLAGGLALLFALYRFIAMVLSEVAARRLAFVLAIASSGLGWLLIGTPAFSYPNVSPIDFWLADAYTLFGLMTFGHYGWSIAALLMTLIAWRSYAEDPSPRRLLWLLLLSVAHGFLQVFELVVVDLVIAIDAFRRAYKDRGTLKRSVVAGVSLALVQGLMAWPYFAGLRYNPMFQVWAQQSRTLSPAPHHYLLGYGLLWLPLVLGMVYALKRKEERFIPLIIWLTLVMVLVYMPGGIQYRWLEGAQVPMAILAAVGLSQVAIPWLMKRIPVRASAAKRAWWLTALFVVATMPSHLYLIGGNTLLAATHWQEAFLIADEDEAIAWLRKNADVQSPVLAGLRVGNAIPGRNGQRVFFGHWAETMYYSEKEQQVSEFFGDMSDSQRQALLHEHGIRYVFHGPDERSLGDFEPGAVSYLALRFHADSATVYEVVGP
ncbi:MAG: hypothetical protein PVF70_03250 [Anaerolineales bacterium]